ncbi:MAG: hypothetical protein QXT53_02090 [Ignisphaera sp.]
MGEKDMLARAQGEYVSAIIMIIIMVLFTILASEWGTYIVQLGYEIINDMKSSKENLYIDLQYEGDGYKLFVVNKWSGTSVIKGLIILYNNSMAHHLNISSIIVPVGSSTTLNINLTKYPNVDKVCIYTNNLNLFCSPVSKSPQLTLNVEKGYWYAIPKNILGNSSGYKIIESETGKEIQAYIWDANKSYIIFYADASTTFAIQKSSEQLPILDTKSWFKPNITPPLLELEVVHTSGWTINNVCGVGPAYGCGYTYVYAHMDAGEESFWFDGKAVHYVASIEYSFPNQIEFYYYAGGEITRVSLKLHISDNIPEWSDWPSKIRIVDIKIAANLGAYADRDDWITNKSNKQFTSLGNRCTIRSDVEGAYFSYASSQVEITSSTNAIITIGNSEGTICAFEPYNTVKVKVESNLPPATLQISKTYQAIQQGIIFAPNGNNIRIVS